MNTIDPILISDDAVPSLVAFCADRAAGQCTLIADENTTDAVGRRIESSLAEAGIATTSVVLSPGEVVADGERLIEILRQVNPDTGLFISAGAGTITDMTRFLSHRLGVPFISCPTAASVDGFASIGAPLVLKGVKTTVLAQPPLAIFADPGVLSAAPPEMTAAGYGDIIGKITSIADWKIGNILWNEPYDESISERTRAAVDSCTSNRDEIAKRTEKGMRVLMNALIETGLCMVEFGESRPASGAEHHMSHYWEMQLMRDGRPAILHGAKVGVATVRIAELYEKIRDIDRDSLAERIGAVHLPTTHAEHEAIHASYGPLAKQLIESNIFIGLDDNRVRTIRERIVQHWPEIQAIAASVPTAAEVKELLHDAGAPTTASQLGISPELEDAAFRYGHYLRNRFTSVKLARFLGLHS